MDILTAFLDDLSKVLAPYWERVEPQLARLETLTGYDWRLVVGGGLAALLLLWLLLRRRGGPKATPKALEAGYERLAAAGVGELDRPYRLLVERWRHLPAAFVQEIVGRLRDKTRVIDFAVLAERHGLERGRLGKIAKAHGPESAMQAVAALLLALGRKRPGEAEAALSLAMRLDPQNPEAVLELAAGHYAAKHYKTALPLLELGISLCRKVVEGPGLALEGRVGGVAPAPVGRRHDELNGLLKSSMEMYEVCLEQVDPQLA
jgi:hypothetical protein